MAIFNKLVVASSFLSCLALAVPFNKREVVWEVKTETAWVTVDITTTIYANGPAPTSFSVTSSSAAASVTSEVSSTPAVIAASFSTPPVSVITSSADADAQFFTTAATSSSVMPTTMSTTVTSSALADTTVIPKQTSGECVGEGSGCSGDVTHWDGGLGACGWVVNTTVQLAIALPVGLMGPLSNTNPYCGMNVTLVNPTSGTTVNAVVMDKCMGCAGYSIDCTDLLFDEITDGTGDGRVHGIEWYFDSNDTSTTSSAATSTTT